MELIHLCNSLWLGAGTKTSQPRIPAIGVAGAEHLGLGYLASFLRSKGVSVQIINAEATGLPAAGVARDVCAIAPDLVGLSPVSVTIGDCLEIAAAVKREISPFVVLGRHLASVCAHEILFNEQTIDAAIVGDGSLSLCHP